MGKRYILATQDHGAFIGTAAEVAKAWADASGITLEALGGDYEKAFFEDIIPSQDETHAVYVLGGEAGEKLAGQCLHCDPVCSGGMD